MRTQTHIRNVFFFLNQNGNKQTKMTIIEIQCILYIFIYISNTFRKLICDECFMVYECEYEL